MTISEPVAAPAVRARMGNPMFVLDGAFEAVAGLGEAVSRVGLDVRWCDLINIRASQLNRCGVCLVQHQREAVGHGMPQEQVFSVAGWQDAPWFSAAERVVLALTEAVTVLDPGAEAVDDELWQEVAAHLDEGRIAAVLLQIALVNTWNRVNRATRQVAGQAW
jgi:AhpD family alkylhydroperoxidase